MNLSLNWLKDYIKLHKKTTPKEIGAQLSLHTVEVEKIVNEADKFNGVVVGKIKKVSKHPNADRLLLAEVNIGDKALQIVCGASNIAPGQLVPVALAGAILPNGVEIKETEVRGVKSSGMLCASDELGLGNDHSGILILNKKAKIGQPLAKYLDLDDIVLEIDNKSLSNRPDLWGHFGMAREIAAIFNLKLNPLSEVIKSSLADITNAQRDTTWLKLKVEVKNEESCPRYMGVAMSGIKIGESPLWMQKRLAAAGMRPINNIVDITNYVMLELGQPMHVFDANLVKNKTGECSIVVRPAKTGEAMETLDGQNYELSGDTLLIANEEKALAIAGVMGGAQSEIGDTTDTIIIESANFNPVSIRKTSGKLGLRTESSIRYEKSLDPNLCETAILRAVELAKLLCPGAHIASNLEDVKKFALNTGPIEIEDSWLVKKIGHKIPSREIVKILNNLGMTTEHIGHKFVVNIPTWRATKDIALPEDIAEEIVRIYGYDNLPPTMPKVEIKEPEKNEERILERKIKNILIGAPALTETYNYSFVGEDQLKKLNIDFSSHIRLANPIASHQTMLRQGLMPNLINNIKANQAKFDSVGLFEIGSIFMAAPGAINKTAGPEERLPYQEKNLAIVVAGDSDEEIFRRVKGIVRLLFVSLKLPVYFKEKEMKPAWSDDKIFTSIMSGQTEMGVIAKLDSQLGRRQGLKKEVVVAEMGMKAILSSVKTAASEVYKPLEKFPSAYRDLAFVVDAKILYNDIKTEIMDLSPMLVEAELFDIYQGDKLGIGKKSLAFHITYQTDRTLTNEEVDGLQAKLVGRLETKFEAKLRDF